MSDAKQNLLLFFYRPLEPCFMQKGEENVVFQLPEHYYPDKYQTASATLAAQFGMEASRKVPVRSITLPDLSLPLQLPYNSQFSVYLPKHRKMAIKLIEIFINIPDLEDLQSLCCYCQLRINPYMFIYCLSVALLHRKDTKGINIPTYVEVFPGKFMDPRVLRNAREICSTVPPGIRTPIEIPQNFTASDREPEQRVAYFREDVGINLHHWHWHLVYPFDAADRAIVNKDRRGELFYYMHQQIMARYNVARLCNKLRRVPRFTSFQERVNEGYFSKLNSKVASRSWPPRFAGSMIHNVTRPQDHLWSEDFELNKWTKRFRQAVDDMAVLMPDGSKQKLDEDTGMDVLGNLIQSSSLSLNRNYYGNLNNMGHAFIGYSHDPDYSNLEMFAVMGDSATAMRDPVFYRWHGFIDDMLQEYKNKLNPYTDDKLTFPCIRVSCVSVENLCGENKFSTQWEKSLIELSGGLDFTGRGSLLARFTHLQHDEFAYKIVVENTSGKQEVGVVRIFMAPTVDEDGKPLPFNEQRALMIELDKFSHSIPCGTSTITRQSTQSSVTIPFKRTFRPQGKRPGSDATFDYCGCGWPHHMLIPKGTPEGYPVVLFVMISNWNEDHVDQETIGGCNDASSYCGLMDRKYPDRRAMGFPFDRPAQASNLTEFLKPNMAFVNCDIKFTDEVRERVLLE